MKKFQVVHPNQDVVKMKKFVITHKKKIIITASVIILNLVFGFDAKFTIINFIWIFL